MVRQDRGAAAPRLHFPLCRLHCSCHHGERRGQAAQEIIEVNLSMFDRVSHSSIFDYCSNRL